MSDRRLFAFGVSFSKAGYNILKMHLHDLSSYISIYRQKRLIVSVDPVEKK